MPVPTQATYSLEAKIAANTALRDLMDSKPGNGYLLLMDSADMAIESFGLTVPCGTVSPTTGKLTLTTEITTKYSAGDYDIAYAVLFDADDVEHLRLPAQEGSAPVSGKIVMSSTHISNGEPIEIVSFEID